MLCRGQTRGSVGVVKVALSKMMMIMMMFLRTIPLVKVMLMSKALI